MGPVHSRICAKAQRSGCCSLAELITPFAFVNKNGTMVGDGTCEDCKGSDTVPFVMVLIVLLIEVRGFPNGLFNP